METTLSYIRQPFNVKAIAEAGLTPEAIKVGDFAVFNPVTGLTVDPASVPGMKDCCKSKITFIVKKPCGGIYQGLVDFCPKNIACDPRYAAPKEEEVQKWKTIIRACGCENMKYATLRVGYMNDFGFRRELEDKFIYDDYFVDITNMLGCEYVCTDNGVMANHFMTYMLYKRILERNPEFYTAEVRKNGSEDALSMEELEALVEEIKNKNSNPDEEDNLNVPLELHIIGKKKPCMAGISNFVDMNYVYPLGTVLQPAIKLNDKENAPWEKYQEMRYAIGRGTDLRWEEIENYNNYSTMNHYTGNMVNAGRHTGPDFLQFEDDKMYHTITFEVDTQKYLRAGKPNMKRMMYILGSEDKKIAEKLAKMVGAHVK